MLIAIIILSYFVLSLLVALLWVGIDCEFDGEQWLNIFLVVICPLVLPIGKFVTWIKSRREHKRIIKLRKERGLPLDGSFTIGDSEDDED